MDIVGSTALAERMDPEALRQIMDRYFAACGTAIAEHGGIVEKFVGDAILAVFGATVTHEDDATRAVRAAVSALAALRDLSAELMASYQVSLEARCGICTGDVLVTLVADGDFRVIGDAVNTASRLQTAAPAGEVLLAEGTAAMVRSQVAIEPVPALSLKGKSRAVAAWRVTSPALPAPDRPAAVAPLIGRDEELEELRQSFRRATRRRQACLTTVLGGPGIGKSRLVQEFLGTLRDGEVTVLSGRCSAYGKGVTYKPLAEMLGSYPGGWTALAALLSGGQGRLAARSLATVIEQAPLAVGESVGVEDISWAVRYLLDILARARPLILVWEDLHWSEQTLLDLVDDVATWLTDVPVLLLCVARTELLESRPGWGGGKPCALALELGPLTYEQSAALVTELAMSEDVYPQEQYEACERVARLCDGNPLFAELLLDVFADSAPAGQVPATIQALLGARLDQLPGPERALVELAATIGREFTRDVLDAMAQADGISEPETGVLLTRLARRRIIRPGPPGSYSFAQTLLRDTAYTFTPKKRREHWHEFLAQRFAAAEQAASWEPLTMAYHAEAAARLHRELQPGDPLLPAQALAAADVLTAEGMRALGRKDLPAAIALLERARELLPPGDARHTALALHICDAGLGLWDESGPMAALAAAEAAVPASRRNAAACAVTRLLVMLRLGLAPPARVAADAAVIEAGLAGDPDDHLSWSRLHQLQAHVHLVAERAAAAEESLRLALARARAMGDGYEEERLTCALCELAQWTPTHVQAGLDLCGALRVRFAANRGLLVPVLVTQAYLSALAGDVPAARHALGVARASTGPLHLDLADAAVMEMAGFVESLAGEHRAAESHYRHCLTVLRRAHGAPDTQNIEVAIARELFGQGRPQAAELSLNQVEAGPGGMSTRARIASTALRGRILSARDRHDEAVALALGILELSERADDPCLAGQALSDLAVVLRAAGREEQAAHAAGTAQRRLAAKGAVVLASRVRDWLDGMEGDLP